MLSSQWFSDSRWREGNKPTNNHTTQIPPWLSLVVSWPVGRGVSPDCLLPHCWDGTTASFMWVLGICTDVFTLVWQLLTKHCSFVPHTCVTRQKASAHSPLSLQCKLELQGIQGAVDHAAAFGRIAFSCPQKEVLFDYPVFKIHYF